PAWKASKRQKRFRGSNPLLSAEPRDSSGQNPQDQGLADFSFPVEHPEKRVLLTEPGGNEKMRKHLDAHPFPGPENRQTARERRAL
ncbi:hypothetical protein, partial [uncultured Alistipes sp.]|uniref:hypothetical protein n=1 Tax=uncultured Alistipes sp. TaxID=538949 RepID=UPI00272CD2E6